MMLLCRQSQRFFNRSMLKWGGPVFFSPVLRHKDSLLDGIRESAYSG